MSLLICQCGFNKTFEILARWPSYILMPLFSIFTFGTETIGGKKYLVCSTRWTLCNLVITLDGLVFGGGLLHNIIPDGPGPAVSVYLFTAFCICAPTLMLIAIALYALVITMKSCCCLFSCSFTERSGLNLDTLEVVSLYLEDMQTEEPILGFNMETLSATLFEQN